MFNSLREELNKIALYEDEELDSMDTLDVADEGAADDELVGDVDEDFEDEEDATLDEIEAGHDEPSAAEIEAVIESIILAESEDSDWEDDEDAVDYEDGVMGDGNDDDLYDDDDEYEELDSVVNSESDDLFDDLEEDDEEDLDDLLEAICADESDICGDSADTPCDVPPSPQYEKLTHRKGNGKEFVDFGNGNAKKYGKVFLDRGLMQNMTVDEDAYDEEGDEYDLYASAGNIYDDDENEEYYGIRNKVKTDTLFGRHTINNVNAAHLQDKYGSFSKVLPEDYEDEYDDAEEALDESVASFLNSFMN